MSGRNDAQGRRVAASSNGSHSACWHSGMVVQMGRAAARCKIPTQVSPALLAWKMTFVLTRVGRPPLKTTPEAGSLGLINPPAVQEEGHNPAMSTHSSCPCSCLHLFEHPSRRQHNIVQNKQALIARLPRQLAAQLSRQQQLRGSSCSPCTSKLMRTVTSVNLELAASAE